MFKLATLRARPVLTTAHPRDKLGRDQLGDATYQISKLYTMPSSFREDDFQRFCYFFFLFVQS